MISNDVLALFFGTFLLFQVALLWRMLNKKPYPNNIGEGRFAVYLRYRPQQYVWVMFNGLPKNLKIGSVKIVIEDNRCYTLYELYTGRFGNAISVSDKNVFSSKEELLKSL